jgi:hypothetical protein
MKRETHYIALHACDDNRKYEKEGAPPPPEPAPQDLQWTPLAPFGSIREPSAAHRWTKALHTRSRNP